MAFKRKRVPFSAGGEAPHEVAVVDCAGVIKSLDNAARKLGTTMPAPEGGRLKNSVSTSGGKALRYTTTARRKRASALSAIKRARILVAEASAGIKVVK